MAPPSLTARIIRARTGRAARPAPLSSVTAIAPAAGTCPGTRRIQAAAAARRTSWPPAAPGCSTASPSTRSFSVHGDPERVALQPYTWGDPFRVARGPRSLSMDDEFLVTCPYCGEQVGIYLEPDMKGS